MKLWPVKHFFGATANPPKSDDKYAQKSVQLVRVSSFRSDFLQNPYFKKYWLYLSFHIIFLKISIQSLSGISVSNQLKFSWPIWNCEHYDFGLTENNNKGKILNIYQIFCKISEIFRENLGV